MYNCKMSLTKKLFKEGRMLGQGLNTGKRPPTLATQFKTSVQGVLAFFYFIFFDLARLLSLLLLLLLASPSHLLLLLLSTLFGSFIRHSLAELMNNLLAKNPHYIRCIKPNTTKKPKVFDEDLVRHQVRSKEMFDETELNRQRGRQ